MGINLHILEIFEKFFFEKMKAEETQKHFEMNYYDEADYMSLDKPIMKKTRKRSKKTCQKADKNYDHLVQTRETNEKLRILSKSGLLGVKFPKKSKISRSYSSCFGKDLNPASKRFCCDPLRGFSMFL